VVYRPCGNRRADACPAWSRVYARDTFAMVRAGLLGGMTVPSGVASNPLAFATLTAPSFGHVRRRRSGTCTVYAPRLDSRRVGAAGPATRRPGASTGAPWAAWRSMRTTTRFWGLRCARTATTGSRLWSGSGGPRSCGAG
jgi:hypothetical protein